MRGVRVGLPDEAAMLNSGVAESAGVGRTGLMTHPTHALFAAISSMDAELEDPSGPVMRLSLLPFPARWHQLAAVTHPR